MKKNILILVSAVLLTFSVSAQITFSTDTASLIMEDGVAHKANIIVSNNSGHDINLRWSLISTTLNDNDNGVFPNNVSWVIQFCECNTCYNNDFGPLLTGANCSDAMANGDSIDWYLTVDPNGQPMIDGEWVIKVENLTDNITDTLTYLAIHPNSVKSITNNANVSSYPNPAKNEFVVNYKLSNITNPTLSVYSIIGSKVRTFSLNQTEGTLRLNTSNFENGLYFFTIEEAENRVFIQKFNVVH